MKRVLLVIAVLLSMVFPTSAEQNNVRLTVYKKGHVEKSTTVQRFPQQLPIDVAYDNETRQITVSGDVDMEVQVYLCDLSGNTLDYSSCLNAVFDVPETYTGSLIVRIEAEGWIAEGEVLLD